MRRVPAALFLAVLVPTVAFAQGPPPPSGFAVENPMLRRIWAIENDSSDLQHLAQVLFDSLGPRLTASLGMTAAHNWLVATYTAWGIPVRKEQYGTWRSWRRGKTHLDLVAPRMRTLEATMLAWSPPTPRGRPVRAPVVMSEDTTHVSRAKRDVFQPRPNGQPGAWPDCQQPLRATPPLAPAPPTPPSPAPRTP